jgi:Glycosyl transferase family 2
MSEIAIVTATRGRAHLLPGLVENVHETAPAGTCELLFVVDDDDLETLEALGSLDARTIAGNGGGYPAKVNQGFHATTEPFVLVSNDDVRFHDGWLDAGLSPFMDPTVGVVGPSDLSPATADGNAATFPIVRREYIETVGGAFDEPGQVLHEGYHHNFSETELWELARHRGVAHHAAGCVIEHLHPDWGKGDEDETYRRGARANWDLDARRFTNRRDKWLAS